MTPKSQKSTYKHYKTGEKPLRNRRHTQGADSKYHRRSRQDKFRQAAKSAFDQRYNKQQKQTQNSPRNVKIWTQKSDENDARRARRIVEDASGSGPDGSPVRPVKSTQLRSRASAPKTVKNTKSVSRNLQRTTVTTNFGVGGTQTDTVKSNLEVSTWSRSGWSTGLGQGWGTVSYTHLTLPTKA